MPDVNALASSSKHPTSSRDDGHKSKKHRKDKHRDTDATEHRGHKDKDKSKKQKDKSKERHGDKERSKDREGRKKQKEKGPFEHRYSSMRLSIPPLYANDWLMGAVEVLNGMIMRWVQASTVLEETSKKSANGRYVPQMGGVLLAHWEHSFADSSLKVINESPFGVCEVNFHAIVWAPSLGQKLYGTHSLSSPSHMSLLFSKTFNVSIPFQHIPTDEYEFEHTGEEADLDSDSDSEDGDFGALGGREAAVHEVGRWKNIKTGKYVGEDGQSLRFTVIGFVGMDEKSTAESRMQVTNQMLSLTGSLLADPSNPPPPPSPSHIPLPASLSPSPEPEQAPRPQKRTNRSQSSASQINGHTPNDFPPALEPSQPRINGGTSSAHEEEAAAPIDDRFLSARELKAKRKAEQKAKGAERKSRREERQLEGLQAQGGAEMVGMNEIVAVQKTLENDPATREGQVKEKSGKKRKGDGEGREGSKKRKERA